MCLAAALEMQECLKGPRVLLLRRLPAGRPWGNRLRWSRSRCVLIDSTLGDLPGRPGHQKGQSSWNGSGGGEPADGGGASNQSSSQAEGASGAGIVAAFAGAISLR